MIGKLQDDHLDVLLETMQKDQRVWFIKNSVWMLKGGIRLIMSDLTIITCVMIFIFLFYFYLFSEGMLSSLSFSNNVNKDKMVIVKYSLMNN